MSTETHIAPESETGLVVEAKGYLIVLEGFPSARIDDVIVSGAGQRALVTALRESGVEALLLDAGNPSAGERFVTHPDGIRFYIGESLYGRTLNMLGEPIDGLGALPPATQPLQLEGVAPGMSARTTMTEPLTFGMTAIDILLPIAKGQRQLVIGPTSSGKNVFLESAVAHQKNSDVVCVYALIGRPMAYIEEIASQILSEEGNRQAILLAARSDEQAPLIYLAPAVAVQIAESVARQGKDVLLILDDLGSHAKYLREIALLSGRIPGRESYPGDLFYEQAHLLERAGFFNETYGGGSLTLLPVLETNIEDMTNLVSTNLMSATDGHLFFSPLLHAEGYFPSVQPSASVTRVGRQTQSTLAKQLSIRIQTLLADYERQQRYSQFGAQLSDDARRTLSQGEAALVFLQQEPMRGIPLEVQIILLSLVLTPLFTDKDNDFAKRNRDALSAVIGRDALLGPVVESARRGTISLEQFLKKLKGVLRSFEAVCLPQ